LTEVYSTNQAGKTSETQTLKVTCCLR